MADAHRPSSRGLPQLDLLTRTSSASSLQRVPLNLASTCPATAADKSCFRRVPLNSGGTGQIALSDNKLRRCSSSPSVFKTRPVSTSSNLGLNIGNVQGHSLTMNPPRADANKIKWLEPSQLDSLDAVLFLDVDGVLHPAQVHHARCQFVPSCMKLIAEVIARTNATIVLSTAWRLDLAACRTLAEKFQDWGLPAFVSRTPQIAMFQRAREILTWVRKHKPKTWVAVDDLPLLEESEAMQGHFVQTRPRLGLQRDNAERIVEQFHFQNIQKRHHVEEATTVEN